jgi:His/Glu/Gln/Arg/opine family amino acid ABC transporter permease subunit
MPAVVIANLPFLVAGLLITLETVALVMLGATALGLAAGVVRAARVPILRQLVFVYVEIIRGTPLLVVLFLVYFALPALTGFRLAAWPAAVTGFIAFTAAYIAEDVRAGIDAVPRGMVEAARATGLGKFQSMAWVVLPVALRRILPTLFNQFVRLIKFTSVASVIGVTELTGATIEVNARDFHPVALIGTLAMVYFALTLAVSQFGRWLARRTAIG